SSHTEHLAKGAQDHNSEEHDEEKQDQHHGIHQNDEARTMDPAPSTQQVAPDGGWGWVVLMANILVLALTVNFPACLSIFFKDLQKEFNTSNSETYWVPSIMTAMRHAGGIRFDA
ncbi:hypothetical protein Z043_125789, partial [Scleropages formosus]